MVFSNVVPAHDRSSPPVSASSVWAKIAATMCLTGTARDPGQMVQAHNGDQSIANAMPDRLLSSHVQGTDVESTFDASGYGQDATTGWADRVEVAARYTESVTRRLFLAVMAAAIARQMSLSFGRVVGSVVSLREGGS
jgi:hypothetical protein